LIDRGFADEQHISALVRQQYQASILTDAGINPVIFKSLDDLDIIRDTARDHDSTAQIISPLVLMAHAFKLSLRVPMLVIQHVLKPVSVASESVRRPQVEQ
jgi:hypothetical protein